MAEPGYHPRAPVWRCTMVGSWTFAEHTIWDLWSPVASARKSEVSALKVEGQGRAVVSAQTPQAVRRLPQR